MFLERFCANFSSTVDIRDGRFFHPFLIVIFFRLRQIALGKTTLGAAPHEIDIPIRRRAHIVTLGDWARVIIICFKHLHDAGILLQEFQTAVRIHCDVRIGRSQGDKSEGEAIHG
jgi:hypothetical protein